MTEFDHLTHFIFDIFPIMHLRFSNMDHVVDFVAAIFDGLLAFIKLAF